VFGFETRQVDLGATLRSAGCPPSRVTTQVLTHLDPDHAGGAYADEGWAGHRVVVHELAREALDEPHEHSERRSVAGALADAGRTLELVDDATDVVPGLRLRSAPGHRTGHAIVELFPPCNGLLQAAEAPAFVFLADALHAREHVAHPEWDELHDSEPAVALATRQALIGELAGSGAVVACSHVHAFGRIERGGGTLLWMDVE
jgi:glyoxylase-like metal-dependent hydrolase (beta-lactamase superfamily II)